MQQRWRRINKRAWPFVEVHKTLGASDTSAIVERNREQGMAWSDKATPGEGRLPDDSDIWYNI